MDAAEGEYLGFVDPDDWVSPHYLEWMAEAMQEQGVPMALVDYLDVQEGDCEPEERLNDRPAARKITTERYPQTGREVGGNAWRMLCHRSVVEDIRFDESLRYAEDALFFTQAAAKAGAYAYLDAPLYYYLKRAGSAMEQSFTIKQYDEVEGLKKAFAVVEDGPQAMQDSVEARRHRRLWWRLPNSNPREKGKVLMLLWFPSLGRGLWKLAKRIQKRT